MDEMMEYQMRICQNSKMRWSICVFDRAPEQAVLQSEVQTDRNGPDKEGDQQEDARALEMKHFEETKQHVFTLRNGLPKLIL